MRKILDTTDVIQSPGIFQSQRSSHDCIIPLFNSMHNAWPDPIFSTLSSCRKLLGGCRKLLGACRAVLVSCITPLRSCRKLLGTCRILLTSRRELLNSCKPVLDSCRELLGTCRELLNACMELHSGTLINMDSYAAQRRVRERKVRAYQRNHIPY